jgi:hypothetical protein
LHASVVSIWTTVGWAGWIMWLKYYRYWESAAMHFSVAPSWDST